MALMRLQDISISYGNNQLLDRVNLTINPGERICLVGRNGTGKSTLMKIIAGEITADDGSLNSNKETKVCRLEQEVPKTGTQAVYDVVAEGLGELGKVLAEYHQLAAIAQDDSALKRLAQLQHRIDAEEGWTLEQRVNSTLSRLELPADKLFNDLSGGLKRRVLLAKALVSDPDILLLDEPTNHLDIDAILWLEEFLLNYRGTLVFITHDRSFLRKLASRILEIDRGQVTDWPGNFDTYQKNKQAALEAEEKQNAEFDKKLAQEEVWIRQGIKARRTRNEGRVRALKQMRKERSERRQQMGNVRLAMQTADRSGKIAIEAENVTHQYDQATLIRNFSTTILRGDKVGIIGPNGCGKTTLLNILLKQQSPTSGDVEHGTKLQVAYFDQLRQSLDLSKSVQDNVAEGSDKVEVNGQSRHVISYLQDFLFTPQRARTPVEALSGGERNRLLLAKLFTKPANLLVMDEPTNDLDVETLELLEELLANYEGTLLIVSHDRTFLDNVVTSSIAYDGKGTFNEYVGGYDDWLRQRPQHATTASPTEKKKTAPKPPAPQKKQKKLGYMEQRELDALPKQIETLEAEVEALHATMGDTSFYQQDSQTINQANEKLAALTQQLEESYERWEHLEEKRDG